MKKILFFTVFTIFNLPAMAEISLSAHQFRDVAKIKLSDIEAQDLFSTLQVKKKPKFKCLESRSAGAQGTSSICIKYAKEPYKFEKTIPGLQCTHVLNPEKFECEFSGQSFSQLVKGDEVLYSNSSGENLSNSARNFFAHLEETTFETTNSLLQIRCETLVPQRYFDCFIKIDMTSPRTSINLGRNFTIKGKKLEGGTFRRQYTKNQEQFLTTQELAKVITHPVESILSARPQDLSFTIAFRDLNKGFLHPIAYNLTGELVDIVKRPSSFRNKVNTILIFELDEIFLNKLAKSVPLTLENIERLNNILGESNQLRYKSLLDFQVVQNKLSAKLEVHLN